jgi:hypothetical protein
MTALRKQVQIVLAVGITAVKQSASVKSGQMMNLLLISAYVRARESLELDTYQPQ